MFKRDLKKELKKYAQFPVIALLGPRQSGKTTLAKETFTKYTYLTFEHEATRTYAEQDPESFLRKHENKHGLIIDEFQYVPNITSYIQLAVDEKKRPGYFVLTGSQNFLVNKAITQSLAGRVGILLLLPLSLHELKVNKLPSKEVDNVIFTGGYPRLYDEHIDPDKFYPSYVQTYIERDVRQLDKVGDLKSFQRFIQVCAGRVGQLLNIDGLASECGISFHTARAWLSILEASYIVFLLEPHYRDFKKRLTKSPKIYFFDTGLACSLLRITHADLLSTHPLRGHLFECLIIADLYKQYCNLGIRPSLYFWRDLNGRHELDCILDEGVNLYPIEIKSGSTVVSDFYKGLLYWNELAGADPSHSYIIYGGTLTQHRRQGNIIGWQAAGTLIQSIIKKP
jgi:uncharacterized protein